MAKKRFIVDFATTVYKTEIVLAETEEEAHAIVDRLYDNEAFMDHVHASVCERIKDAETFGENTEAFVAFEDKDGDWDELTPANGWLG